MKYRVTHLTSYEYPQFVNLSHNEARLVPRDTPHQRVSHNQLNVAPQPERLSQSHDYFGNAVQHFWVQGAHAQLDVTSVSELELTAGPSLEFSSSPAWDTAYAALDHRDPEHLAALELTFVSPFVRDACSAATSYAAASFVPGRPVLEAVAELCERIYQDFEYAPGSTSVVTPLTEVMKTRRGVCQDFAHLTLAMLRALGVPARYVSGYLHSQPPPGSPRLIGADASHAWLSVYCPPHGYVDFDPTNGVMPSGSHLTLAWGRDFGDVSPLKGVILGTGLHVVRVGVTVERLEEVPMVPAGTSASG